MSGPFTGRGKRVSGSEQGGSPPKFSPGTYYVRLVKGVYKESAAGHGTYTGIETLIVKVDKSFSKEENSPYEPSRMAGQAVSWVFNLHLGNSTREGLALGNMNNIATAIQDTHGFMSLLSEEEAIEYDELLTAAEGGDEKADPAAWLMDKLVGEGGESLTGLPLRIVARDGRGKSATRLFCVCSVYPVNAEELELHYAAAS